MTMLLPDQRWLPQQKVILQYLLSFPWVPEEWPDVRQHIPWLLTEQSRIRKAGWFN